MTSTLIGNNKVQVNTCTSWCTNDEFQTLTSGNLSWNSQLILCFISSFQMHDCPQVSVSVNDNYSQAWRTDKYLHYLLNFLNLLINGYAIYNIFAKNLPQGFEFFNFHSSKDDLKCIQEIRKIKVTLRQETMSTSQSLVCADQKF